MLGVLPLIFLTEIGFVVAFGVLLDTFIVRSILVPALVLDIGRRCGGRRALAQRPGRSAAHAAASSRATSSAPSASAAAATFSSRCADRAGAGDRQQHRRAREQPGERDLAGRRVVALGDLGDDAAGLGELARREREPREEAEAVALADVEHVLADARSVRLKRFWTVTTSTIARACSSCSTETFETPMWRILPSSCSSFSAPTESAYGHLGIGRVQLVEVDAVHAQAGAASPRTRPQVLGPAVARPLPRAGPLEPALRRDDEIVGVGVQRLGDELLGDVRAVAVGGVDEVDAELDGAAQHGDRGVVVGRRAPDARRR